MSSGHVAEEVEEVDTQGHVLRVVPRALMRIENLLHRSVYVAVLTDAVGQVCLVVHRRSDTKDVNPGKWDLAFGGVCDVGEDEVSAARRELSEEAGLFDIELRRLGSGHHEGEQVKVLGAVFVAQYDGPVSSPDGEVVEVTLVPVEHLEEWVDAHSVCADSVSLVLPRVLAVVDSLSTDEI